MDSTVEQLSRRDSYLSDANPPPNEPPTIPIIQTPMRQPSAPSPGDPMETTMSSSAMMAPPARTSPEATNGTHGTHEHMGVNDQPSSGSLAGPSAAAAAAAGAQQPKVVQTAFIHKLYNMLEDPNIQNLISWSNSAESFVMSPSNDFSKVLSQYFKHTNISSFVRQLNMYGFHKVSDVFHTGSPESPLWEFKHGNGNFKRGDLVGLREIKRRASRHALVHRDSYSAPKPPLPQPGNPAEPMHSMQESTESRLTNLEHTLYDMHARLQRSEDNSQFLHVRNQIVMDALSRSLQLNHEMSRAVLSLVPNPETPIHRDVLNMQAEIQRQAEVIRSMDESPDAPFSGSRPYFSNLSLDNAPVSPHQMPQDDPRRGPPGPPTLGVPPRQNFFKPQVPSHLSLTPARRYGSIGTAQSSPSSLRPQAPPPPPPPHPLATVSPPPTNLSRRHTSADIRNVTGWQQNTSPFGSGQSSSQWPSSPKRTPTAMTEDQRIRDSLSSYSLTNASQSRADISRPTTPPFSNGNTAEYLNSWSWGPSRDKTPTGHLKDSSGPPTRRGSMAHILNPAETAERDEEHEEDMREEDRKRKRLQ
ncbi:HSF-type DNA-binding-domain-containing protein [Amylocarpus encephaloides]|uniref:HSF-type DNA-binding-domain-containing protein n=1 Tax=Amylocarpus encephaloides TaxID=45428 RepID=A0A9P7YR54_9HELO|nr:HSF-type DNA-binding-domain-containing protein [Amylocarpus encephaloides]